MKVRCLFILDVYIALQVEYTMLIDALVLDV